MYLISNIKKLKPCRSIVAIWLTFFALNLNTNPIFFFWQTYNVAPDHKYPYLQPKTNDPSELFQGLSNWYDASITMELRNESQTKSETLNFPTVEHYLMFHKILSHPEGGWDSAIKILKNPSPAIAKKLGRGKPLGNGKYQFNENNPKWHKNKHKHLKDGLEAKTEQNIFIKNLLLGTENAILAEASPYDIIYGIGMAENHPSAKNITSWPKNSNLLGETWMKIRKELQEKQQETLENEKKRKQMEDSQNITKFINEELNVFRNNPEYNKIPFSRQNTATKNIPALNKCLNEGTLYLNIENKTPSPSWNAQAWDDIEQLFTFRKNLFNNYDIKNIFDQNLQKLKILLIEYMLNYGKTQLITNKTQKKSALTNLATLFANNRRTWTTKFQEDLTKFQDKRPNSPRT